MQFVCRQVAHMSGGATCGDPRMMAESVASYTECLGYSFGVTTSLALYLAPLIVLTLFVGIGFYIRRRESILCWPDALLLFVPVAIWYVLALAYPVGRPTSSFWELLLLGTIGGLTILFRCRSVSVYRVEFSKIGLLGTSSLAVNFWAFMPVSQGLH